MPSLTGVVCLKEQFGKIHENDEKITRYVQTDCIITGKLPENNRKNSGTEERLARCVHESTRSSPHGVPRQCGATVCPPAVVREGTNDNNTESKKKKSQESRRRRRRRRDTDKRTRRMEEGSMGESRRRRRRESCLASAVPNPWEKRMGQEDNVGLKGECSGHAQRRRLCKKTRRVTCIGIYTPEVHQFVHWK